MSVVSALISLLSSADMPLAKDIAKNNHLDGSLPSDRMIKDEEAQGGFGQFFQDQKTPDSPDTVDLQENKGILQDPEISGDSDSTFDLEAYMLQISDQNLINNSSVEESGSLPVNTFAVSEQSGIIENEESNFSSLGALGKLDLFRKTYNESTPEKGKIAPISISMDIHTGDFKFVEDLIKQSDLIVPESKNNLETLSTLQTVNNSQTVKELPVDMELSGRVREILTNKTPLEGIDKSLSTKVFIPSSVIDAESRKSEIPDSGKTLDVPEIQPVLEGQKNLKSQEETVDKNLQTKAEIRPQIEVGRESSYKAVQQLDIFQNIPFQNWSKSLVEDINARNSSDGQGNDKFFPEKYFGARLNETERFAPFVKENYASKGDNQTSREFFTKLTQDSFHKLDNPNRTDQINYETRIVSIDSDSQSKAYNDLVDGRRLVRKFVDVPSFESSIRSTPAETNNIFAAKPDSALIFGDLKQREWRFDSLRDSGPPVVRESVAGLSTVSNDHRTPFLEPHVSETSNNSLRELQVHLHKQVIGQLWRISNTGQNRAIVELEPKELGKVVVTIDMNKGQDGLKLVLHTETFQAAQALQQDVHKLRQLYASFGIDLHDFHTTRDNPNSREGGEKNFEREDTLLSSSDGKRVGSNSSASSKAEGQLDVLA